MLKVDTKLDPVTFEVLKMALSIWLTKCQSKY